MAIRITNLRDVAARTQLSKTAHLKSFTEGRAVTLDALVARTVGFHVYGDLEVKNRMEKANTEDMARLFLEAIEETVAIAAAFTQVDDIWLFEAQGRRFHLFIDADTADEASLNKLLAYCSYVAQSVDNRVRAIIPDDYVKFSLAVDHGRAVVISTGRAGGDSLISLGNAANVPAKRLSRTDISDGNLVIPIELARKNPVLAKECAEQSGSNWVHVNVLLKRFVALARDQIDILECVATTTRVVDEGLVKRAILFEALAAKSDESTAASVQQPLVVKGLVFRADLHGFTRKIEEAYDRGEAAVSQVVQEFIDILKLPDAFEQVLGNPSVRLPWAGDCYTLVIQPRTYEDYAAIRRTLPAIVCYLWHDPDGTVNEKRPAGLRQTAPKHKWSVGIAGGTESEGHVLLANINTSERRFLVAAGWSQAVSLEAQNAGGLAETESAIHVEDHRELEAKFQEAFTPWGDSRGLRKATLKRLTDAHNGTKVEVITPSVPNIVVPSRPYFCG